MDGQSRLRARLLSLERKPFSSRCIDDQLTALEPGQHTAQERFGERARKWTALRIKRLGDGMVVLNGHNDLIRNAWSSQL